MQKIWKVPRKESPASTKPAGGNWSRARESSLLSLFRGIAILREGQAGFCFILRQRRRQARRSLGYLLIRPLCKSIRSKKKPLNHFLPGTRVFSMGTAGCNMGCFFCQNWDISEVAFGPQVHSSYVPPEDVVLLAIRNGCFLDCEFTYNEPTIWGEYVIDICHAAKEHGLNTVMVSNGYITYDAFHDIYDHIDAANIDLKGFTSVETFYGAKIYADAGTGGPAAGNAAMAQEGNERLGRNHESDYSDAQ